MLVTEEGMVIAARLEHPWKALLPMLVTLAAARIALTSASDAPSLAESTTSLAMPVASMPVQSAFLTACT